MICKECKIKMKRIKDPLGTTFECPKCGMSSRKNKI